MFKNPYYYLGVNPTVDLLIINPDDEILLIKRSDKSAACPSMWAFPGGFIDSKSAANSYWVNDLESPNAAAIRELKEETNLSLEDTTELILVGEYEGGGRDPRDNAQSWSKTYAFLYCIDKEIYEKQKHLIRGQDDAIDAKWFALNKALEMNLAFDHAVILKNAFNFFIKR